jgi:DNA-binding response OmpR family regulator
MGRESKINRQEVSMWLLLIEDEVRLADSLKAGLEEEGYLVDVAYNGVEGEALALANAYDALIVDWRLPDRDGKTVIVRLRAAGRQYPILMLTALGDLEHRVAGLDAGADDYLAKPFKFEELLARLRALLRRPPLVVQEQVLRLGSLELDTRRRQAALDGAPMDLRPKEYALLEDLMRHPDEVLSRTVIAERVWGDPFYVTDNVIDVTISSLRQKLASAQAGLKGQQALRIETVRGVGYRLTTVSAT